MTDKTEAQPEALRLAEWLEVLAKGNDVGQPKLLARTAARELRRQHAEIQQFKAQITTQTNRAAATEQQVTALTQRLDMANRLNTDARDQLAQLSARQAAPEGWRLVPESPTEEMQTACKSVVDLEQGDPDDHRYDDGRTTVNAIYAAMLSAAPPPPEREPLSKQQVSKIALDLLMTNCTWHALQNTGFFHEIVPFTVEIVAAAERAHGIGATNAR